MTLTRQEQRSQAAVQLSTPELTRPEGQYKITIFGPIKGASHEETRYEGQGETMALALCDLMVSVRRRNPEILMSVCRNLEKSFPEDVKRLK